MLISELSRSLIEIAWYFGSKGLNENCCGDLSMSEFIALDKISNTVDCPIQEIGQTLGFTKSGSTRIVNRLEKKGYVRKLISTEDARICCVVITEKGEEIIKKSDIGYIEKFDQLLEKMPEKFHQETKAVLKAIAKAIKK